MKEFPDHFSSVAAEYAKFRPNYPKALIRTVVQATPGRHRAWDCGTGTGQVATALASDFNHVVATDGSAAQLANARPHARITYIRAVAEAAPFDDCSVDLVVVAQALHWFRRDAFYAETRRVLRPQGVLAVWSYGPVVAEEPSIADTLRMFHDDVLGPWWPPQRALVGAALLREPFPFPEYPIPRFSMQAEMTLAGLLGYMGTWSAVRRCRTERGIDPIAELAETLEQLWGNPSRTRRITWPLYVRVGKKGLTGG